MQKTEERYWYKLAAGVPKSVAAKAADCIEEAHPLNQWEWLLISKSGKTYRAGLKETADGWLGYCECPSFLANAAKEKRGRVQACKHLVWLRQHERDSNFYELGEPEADGGGSAAATAPAAQAQTAEPETVTQETAKLETEPIERRDSDISARTAADKSDASMALAVPEEAKYPITADPEAAKRAMILFEEVKRAILGKDDTVKAKDREYIRRSGFRKIAMAYRLSTQLLERRWERIGNEVVAYAAYRAIAPNGRYADGEGWCSLDEANVKRLAGSKGMSGKQYHVAAAIAATRAINRAIADLIGGGQVSAEEIDAGYWEDV